MVRFSAFILAVLGAVGCVAAPAPEANGYNVQLFFEGVPLGSQTLVGQTATIVVRRIEQRPDQCATQGCDPTIETPIVLVSAKCDAVCDVTPVTSDDGSVTLQAIAQQAGATTLRVHVRSTIDGSEWDDGYPLAFREPPPSRAIVPNVTVDKLLDQK